VLSHVDWDGKKVLIVDKCDNPANHSGVQNFKIWSGDSVVPDQLEEDRKVNLYNKGFEEFLKEYASVFEESGIRF
jgi:hypothetical protein